jgi:hypothetical protein
VPLNQPASQPTDFFQIFFSQSRLSVAYIPFGESGRKESIQTSIQIAGNEVVSTSSLLVSRFLTLIGPLSTD